MNFGYNYLTGQREFTRGTVTIYEYERGLEYRDGRFIQVLEAGRYRLWAWQRRRVVIVDVRRATAQIANQKLLTSDQVTVTLNIVADYEIADPALALHTVTSYLSQFYEDVQIVARNAVGAITVDVLLEQRSELNARLLETVHPLAEGYGLRVLTVAIKDVILAPKVRDLLMKEVEARRTAAAMLIGAREEVAALRALANAAKLAADHPHLLRLRELDTVRAFAGNGGNTVVVGVGGNLPVLKSNAGNGRQTVSEPTIEEDE
jgi:regulator of protease activity HflC (stomatin/prohibitin superfamily)